MKTVYALFPSERQLHLLEDLAPHASRDVAAVVQGLNPARARGSLRVLSTEEALVAARSDPSAAWFCCNEHAVYFAAKHRALAPVLGFRGQCLDMLTKIDMSAGLEAAGVRVIPKTILGVQGNDCPSFPFVVKPNVGFASVLVRRIASRAELDEYCARFADNIGESLVQWYQGEYFSASAPTVLVEPEIADGKFVSVSMCAVRGELAALFMVEGVERISNATSDYQWRKFRAPAALSPRSAGAIRQEMEKAVKAFATDHAVFEAEVLVDAVTEEPFVLEFSPRIVGGFIPELILHSFGVDLERAALAFALGIHAELAENAARRCLLINRDDTSAGLPLTLLSAQSRTLGHRRIVDEVYALD